MESPAARRLRRAISRPDGTMARISRIELEPLDAVRCRWTLWQDGRRLYTAVAGPDDLPALLMAVRMILDCQMSGPPAARAKNQPDRGRRPGW